MKYTRQKEIIELIQQFPVGSQEALQALLKQRGFPVTQATVSRDIRELNLTKKAGSDGVYRYIVPDLPLPRNELFAGNVTGVDYAGNTVVVKCRSGTAQAVCTVLDGLDRQEIVGTLAGDDTIFVLVRTAELAKRFASEFLHKILNR